MTHPTRFALSRLLALLFAAWITVGVASAATADALDDAKASGAIGEQRNGFLGLVDKSASPDVIELVKSVNNKRKAAYSEIAAKNSTSISAVAKLAGEKAIAKTKSGQYVQASDGSWQKK